MFMISNLYVPSIVQEALDDSNWKLVVMEMMNALKKITHGVLLIFPETRKQFSSNGCL